MVSNGIGKVSVIEWSGEDCLPPFLPVLSAMSFSLSLPPLVGQPQASVSRCGDAAGHFLCRCVCMLDDICSPGPLQPQRQSLCIHCSGQHTHPSSQVTFQLTEGGSSLSLLTWTLGPMAGLLECVSNHRWNVKNVRLGIPPWLPVCGHR